MSPGITAFCAIITPACNRLSLPNRALTKLLRAAEQCGGGWHCKNPGSGASPKRKHRLGKLYSEANASATVLDGPS